MTAAEGFAITLLCFAVLAALATVAVRAVLAWENRQDEYRLSAEAEDYLRRHYSR